MPTLKSPGVTAGILTQWEIDFFQKSLYNVHRKVRGSMGGELDGMVGLHDTSGGAFKA